MTSSENKHLARLSTVRIQEYLDRGAGSCALRNAEVATLICGSLNCFDEQRYRLFAWRIMPNHVHVVARIFPRHDLAEILHSWKSFTAKAVNRILQTHGSFWQKEYYDHLLRNQGEYERALEYVLDNPSKARLKNWPWVWARGQDARATAGEDAGATQGRTAGP